MIKATIQRTPYATEMTFPCAEAQLSTWLDELRMNPEHLCPAATITQIEPSELSVLEDCEVSLDALNYLAKRMDGMDAKEQNQFFTVLTCEELNMVWGLKNIINLTFNLDRFTLIEDTSDIEKVGLTHMLNIRGDIACSELENKGWLIEEGQKLLDSGKGIQTEYGLLFVNDGIEFAEIFNGTMFPQYYCDPDAVVSVEIFYCGLTEYVELPCEDMAVKKAVCRLGANIIKSCRLSADTFKNVPSEWQDKFGEFEKSRDIFGLNSLLKTADICIEQPMSVFMTEVEGIIRNVSEYCSVYEKFPLMNANGLTGDYRCLSEFNGTVLAAKNTEYGFEFVTWDRTFDGNGVTQGNYYSDYSAAKENFSVRSGLIEKNKLFDVEELENVCKCVNFTARHNGDLKFDDCENLKRLGEKISESLPEAQQSEAPELSM